MPRWHDVTASVVVRIRPATELDAGALSALANAAYSHYIGRIGRAPAPMLADYAEAIATHVVWVAEEHDQLIGLLVLQVTEDHLELENVAVLPQAQQKGIGSLLLKVAEAMAKDLRLKHIRLYTNEAMAENLGYYGRRGYVETHRAVQDGYRRIFFVKAL